MRTRGIFWIGVISVFTLSACKTNEIEKLDLNEAKNIAARFENIAQERKFKRKDAEEILDKIDNAKIDPDIEKYLQKSISILPKNAKEFYERGIVRRQLGLQLEADKDLEKAAELDRTPQHLFALAISKFRLGKPQTGLRLLEEVIELTEIMGLQGYKVVANLWLSMIDSQMGNFTSSGTRISEMERIYMDSADWRSDPPRDLYLAHIAIAKSRLASEKGETEAALQYAQEAIKSAKKDWRRHKKGEARYLDRAGAISSRNLQKTIMLRRSGRIRDAEISAYRAIQFDLDHFGSKSYRIAESLTIISRILGETGKPTQALEVAKRANQIIIDLGIPTGSLTAGKVKGQLAKSLLLSGKYRDAYKIFSELQKEINPVLKTFTIGKDLFFGISAYYVGNLDVAHSYFAKLLDDRRKKLGDKSYDTALAAMALATVKYDLKPEINLAEDIKRYVPILLSRSRQVEGESSAIIKFQNEFVFNGILKYISGLGNKSFNIGSKNRKLGEISLVIGAELTSGLVQRALSSSSARMGLKDKELSRLARGEQDALRRISALNALLVSNLSRPEAEQSPTGIAKIESDIAKYRAARAKFREAIEQSYPGYAELVDPTSSRALEAIDVVRQKELIVQIYVGPTSSYVWSVNHRKEITFRRVKVSRERLGRIVNQLRSSLDPKAATIGEIPEYDMRLAYFLYEQYLKTVIERERGLEKISFVQHGHLGMLPMSALITSPFQIKRDADGLFSRYIDAPFLIKKYAVAQLPSLSALTALRRIKQGKDIRRPFLGVGDPLFISDITANKKVRDSATDKVGQVAMRGLLLKRRSAPSATGLNNLSISDLQQLPDTKDEVLSVARVLNADLDREVLLGKNATESNIKKLNLSNRKVVMFATHGLLSGELDGLDQPALALANPKYDVGQKGDGLLTVDEVLNLSLDADWVVLSACNTGAGDGQGAEAISGLGRAFFYAGTRALLVTNWPVETTSARVLTTSLFEKATESASTRSKALRDAMLDLLNGPGALDGTGKKSLFRYAHPIFWAPFSLIGD